MPIIYRHACNMCDFEMPAGWGRYTYAVDDAGSRVVCGHPCEAQDILKITGLGYSEAIAAGRAGYGRHYVCLDCLQQFGLDPHRDVIACTACRSSRVMSLDKLIGQPCPKCKLGVFEECSPIRWKLDPDWEKLPVPHIVKRLVRYSNDREIPLSLETAAKVAEKIDQYALRVLTNELLNWWEGDYFLKDSEPEPSLEMNPQWTWCQTLLPVLEVTPSLAALIDISEGRCSLGTGVDPEVWRGIKNYIRKYREHILMS